MDFSGSLPSTGREQTSMGDPKSPKRSAVVRAQHQGGVKKRVLGFLERSTFPEKRKRPASRISTSRPFKRRRRGSNPQPPDRQSGTLTN